MTKEEALRILDTIPTKGDEVDALEMAISALEQSVDVPTDTISRQAAIDALDGDVTVTGRANADAVLGYANLICDRIKGLPSAQRKGKWKFEKMKHIINGEVRDVMICSECDAGWFRYDISDNTVRCIPNYCPNCGARMMKGEEDETY